MARKASVRYWPGRKGGGYFCVFRGRRYELALGPNDAPQGPTYLAAHTRFREIVAGDGARRVEEERRQAGEAERLRKGSQATVREILEAYLKHISKTKKPGTVEIRQRCFLPFVNHPAGGSLLGEKPVAELTHQDLYQFLEQMEKPRRVKRKVPQKGRKPVAWGPGSQRNCLLGLAAAFNWAQRSGGLPANPLTGIEKPSPASRGVESLIGATTEEVAAAHARILASSRTHWRPFLQALKDTGARPGELCAATGADFRPDLGAFVFLKESTRRAERFSHTTARKKDRVVFLSGRTLEHVRGLVREHPSGPLFRRANGQPFTTGIVVDRFVKLRRRLAMPHLTAYSYRHQYATDMLKAGMDVDTLAELMGNSALVIRQHYSHLLADAKGLREKLERFRGAGGS